MTQNNNRKRLDISDEETLGDARSQMQQHTSPPGVYCPCCGRPNVVYNRGIGWKSAAWLCWLVSHYLQNQRWYAVTEYSGLRGGDYAKLLFWDLVELRDPTDYDKRTSGMWKPTEAGIKFARGLTRIPAQIKLYNNEFRGYVSTSKTVDIHELLKGAENFNWQELMHSVL